MRLAKACITIYAWTPAIGAKGKLQQAWFRIKGIPVDQRSIKTTAMVDGLVGKMTELDEKTRYKPEYVRARIACRDVTRVPRMAEGTLGIYVFDFHFEREVLDEEEPAEFQSEVKVKQNDEPPQPKKPRTDLGDKGDDDAHGERRERGAYACQQQQYTLAVNTIQGRLRCNLLLENWDMIESRMTK